LSRTLKFSDAEIAHARQLLIDQPLSFEALTALSVLLPAAITVTTATIASILGVSRPTVTRHHAAARTACSEEPSESRAHAHGGRRRQTLTIEEEKKFLEHWLASAKEGGVLTVGPIHKALQTKIGRTIALSTTYRMLARHGWRKIVPDTRHPKANPQAQEDFKKNLKPR
jgi:transposase